jgi:hypothetical protein
MKLSLLSSKLGMVLAAMGIAFTELAVGIATSATSPAIAASALSSNQADADSTQLTQPLSVSQMTKDDDDKADKDDDDDVGRGDDDDDDDDGDDDEVGQDDNDDGEVAQDCTCKDAVFKDVSKKTGIDSSKLKLVKVEKETWSDGCLGLPTPGSMCTQAEVPGWRVVVASGEERWVYRTDVSGSMVKLDQVATQTLANSLTQMTGRREVITRTTQTTQSVTGTSNRQSQNSSQSTQTVVGNTQTTGGYTNTQQQTRLARSSALVSFKDVSENHWARTFIGELANRGILTGFPDGNFYPDKPVTRAEFAALVASVFKTNKVRNAVSFRDVSSSYWAYNGIREAYEMGFLGPVSGSLFRPYQSLTRLQILTALTRGLNYTSTNSSVEEILSVYRDAGAIPASARSLIAAATERGMVVNYPNTNMCSPNKVATRAEVAAFLYQAMVNKGEAAAISSPYVAGKSKIREAGVVQEADDVRLKPARQNCNQGIGNGAEGCDPGNSRPHGGSNDEGGRTPGNRPQR